MFRRSLNPLAVGLALLAGTVAARAAAPTYVIVDQSSSPVWWSTTGDHADLVVSYSARATMPLQIDWIETNDIGGASIDSGLYGCGQLLFGGPPGSRQLMPGDSCVLRAYRSQYEIASRLVMWDRSGSAANINNFVRASVEVRDAADNVLTHVDLR